MEITKKVERISLAAVGGCMSFMLCIFAPFTMYIGNSNEFLFSLYQMLPAMAAAFALMFSLLYITGFLICETKADRFFFAVLCFLLLFFYIQGNYIPRNYGVLNGSEIRWDDYPGYAAASIIAALFSCVVILAVWMKRKKSLFFFGRYLAIGLFLVQCMTMAVQFAQNYEILNKNSTAPIAGSELEFELSDRHNVIVILLDAFDSFYMRELLSGEDADEYRALFADFTFYPDTLGMYPTTKGALPQILTGRAYINEAPYDDYIQKAYEGNELYKRLRQLNYSVGVYTGSAFLCADEELFDNVHQERYIISDYPALAKSLLRLAAFQYMPHQWKRYFYIDTSAFSSLAQNENGTNCDLHMQVFDQQLTESGLATEKRENSFRFYHLDGIHAPHTFGKDLISDPEKSYSPLDEAEGNCTVLRHYFDALRENNLYDCSTIILMADHGSKAYSQNPLFMLKNAYEKHSLLISEEKVTYDNFQNILLRVVEGKQADELFVSGEPGARESRRFLFYSWDDTWDKQYLPTIREAFVRGNAFDAGALQFSGQTYDTKSEYNAYGLGTELDFSTGVNTAREYYHIGFSWPDAAGTWIGQSEAVMRFRIENTDSLNGDILLSMDYDTYLSEERVEVYSNDQMIAQYTAHHNEQKQLLIPKGSLDGDLLELRFVLPDSVSPSEQGTNSNDIRRLALFMRTMTLELAGTLTAQAADSIDFTDGGNCDGWLLDGWNSRENDFRWTTGEASLLIPDSWQAMRIEYWTYWGGPENTEIECGGVSMGFLPFHENMSGEVIKLPEGRCRVITFRTKGAASPKSRGESEDNRELGIAVSRISSVEAE